MSSPTESCFGNRSPALINRVLNTAVYIGSAAFDNRFHKRTLVDCQGHLCLAWLASMLETSFYTAPLTISGKPELHSGKRTLRRLGKKYDKEWGAREKTIARIQASRGVSQNWPAAHGLVVPWLLQGGGLGFKIRL
eukprot:1019051-Pelagomonas_calceolata.AAC.2